MPSAPASCRTPTTTATRARTRSATSRGPSAASTCRTSRRSGSGNVAPARGLPAAAGRPRDRRTAARALEGEGHDQRATGSSWGSSRPRRCRRTRTGFPFAIIEEFAHRTGRGVLGNVAASGTEIIQELGEEHQAHRQVDRLHVGGLRLPGCRPRGHDSARRALPRVRDRARDPEGPERRRPCDRAALQRASRATTCARPTAATGRSTPQATRTT